MSIKGASYQRFRRACRTKNALLVRGAAAELPRLDLADALRVTLVLAAGDPGYPRVAARWIGRFALENPRVTLKELGVAAAALDLLPDAPGSPAKCWPTSPRWPR